MFGKILFGVAGLGFMLGCSMPVQAPAPASAQLMDRNGRTVGTVTFRDAAGGVVVNVEVNAMSPGGCTTNLWVNFSLRRPIFPKLLPSTADLAATQGDNRVGASDSPPHA